MSMLVIFRGLDATIVEIVQLLMWHVAYHTVCFLISYNESYVLYSNGSLVCRYTES